MLLSLITNLLTIIFKVFLTLIQFLIIVILGLVAAILFALPWLLRAASLLLWLGATYLGITSIQTIYAPYSPAIPVIALQLAVILISVGWVAILLWTNNKLFWGGMAAVGLVVGGASIGSAWLLTHWQYADLFFRVLPSAIFAVLLIYETIRLRSMHRNGSVTLSAPAFMWFKRRNVNNRRVPPQSASQG